MDGYELFAHSAGCTIKICRVGDIEYTEDIAVLTLSLKYAILTLNISWKSEKSSLKIHFNNTISIVNTNHKNILLIKSTIIEGC